MHRFSTRDEAMQAIVGEAVGAAADEFEACRELLRCYWELLEGTLPKDGPVLGRGTFGRPLNRDGDLLILSLASRATSQFHALVELSRLGFGAEALTQGRTLFETIVDLHWANANLVVALNRYEQHERMEQWLAAQRDAPYLDADDEGPRAHRIEAPADLADLQRLFGETGHRHWSGLGTRRRTEIAADLVDEPDLLRMYRDLALPLHNAMVHTSATSMHQTVGWDALRSGILSLRYGPSPRDVNVALFGAHWCYQQVLKLVWREFKVTTRNELEDLLERNQLKMISD